MNQAPADPTDRLLVFGINHRSASGPLREQLVEQNWDHETLMADLRGADLDKAVLLITCDRLEVLIESDDPDRDTARLQKLLATWTSSESGDFRTQGFERRGEEALRHVFAVAASLDSQIVGEPQVLGQVKESHRLSALGGLVTSPLDAVLQASYGAAKRVRTETPLAERPVSIVASTLLIARSLHGDLSKCAGLLLGLGEISELLASELREAGLANLVVMHRSPARAAHVAQRFACQYRPTEERDQALVEADIIISAVGLGRFALSAADVEAALKNRRRRPILLVDTALPGDIEPAAQDLDGAFVYTLEDLEAVAMEGRAGREAAARAAWLILEEEVAAFRRQGAERMAAPSVVHLRDHFEAVRAEVMAQSGIDADTATRLLVKRLLHGPSEALRGAAAADPALSQALERALGQLFPAKPAGGAKEDET